MVNQAQNHLEFLDKVSVKDFDLEGLNLDRPFGDSEGESDELDITNFIETESVKRFLSMNYTYVVSPKGSGKTALCKALRDQIALCSFDYSKYFIVNIDNSFGFDDDYLNVLKFKQSYNYKTYIMAWSIYLLAECIKKINNKRNDLLYTNDFFKKINKYELLHKELKLHSLIEHLEELSVNLTMNINGQSIGISPSVKMKNHPYEKTDLNEIYGIINEFFKKNGKTLLILIDHIDNFVTKEQHSIQQCYLQGLVSFTEEIINYSHIKTILFIRTDLYYSFSISAEYDKIKQRTIQLEWRKHEVMKFVAFRLLRIPYIWENYFRYFSKLYRHGIYYAKKDRGWFSKISLGATKFLIKKEQLKIVKQYDLERNAQYVMFANFLKLFIPKEIEHKDNKREKIKSSFCEWFFTHFRDGNDYINPRLIINYFNALFRFQYDIYRNDYDELIIKRQYCHFNKGEGLNVFMSECMQKCYEEIQKDELIKIKNLIGNKEEKKLFREINRLSFRDGIFYFKRIENELTNYKIKPAEYNNLLRYLNVLGFLKDSDDDPDKKIIPILFMQNLQHDNADINISEYEEEYH